MCNSQGIRLAAHDDQQGDRLPLEGLPPLSVPPTEDPIYCSRPGTPGGVTVPSMNGQMRVKMDNALVSEWPKPLPHPSRITALCYSQKHV